MVGFLVLLNQLICKFSGSLRGILEEVFPVVADRIFKVIPIDGLTPCTGTVTDVVFVFINSSGNLRPLLSTVIDRFSV